MRRRLCFPILVIAAATATPGHAAANPSARFVEATATCIAATSAAGVDEDVLARDGWQRVSTDAEEAKGVRTFGRADHVPIMLPSKAGGCVVQSDSPPSDGVEALIQSLTTAYGNPKVKMPGLALFEPGPHALVVINDRRGTGISVAMQ